MERNVIYNEYSKFDRFSGIIENTLIVVAVVIFTVQYTVIGVLKGEIFSPLKNIVMLAIFSLFIYRFFTVSKEERKRWFTEKFIYIPSFVWLLLFFVVRCIAFVSEGFQYGIVREIFFEFVFLVALCGWTVGDKVRMEIITVVFCVINLIVNIVNTYCVHVIDSSFGGSSTNQGLVDFLSSLGTYCSYGSGYNAAILYSNPNSAGIMTGMALLLSLLLIKNKKRLPVMIVYWGYSFYVLVTFDARGAMLSLITAIVCMIITLAIKKLSPKTIIIACFMISVSAATGVYILIGVNLSDGDKSFTGTEEQINLLSTGRYKIWQDCYIAHDDKKIFGTGSPTLEKNERNDYLKNEYEKTYGTVENFVPTTFSVHNGYLATIFVTGWAGFILFVIIMLDKICKAKIFRNKNKQSIIFAAVVIFTLMVSNFEALLITSRYYTVLIMLAILAWNRNKEGEVNADSVGKQQTDKIQ